MCKETITHFSTCTCLYQTIEYCYYCGTIVWDQTPNDPKAEVEMCEYFDLEIRESEVCNVRMKGEICPPMRYVFDR